jgi:hypothetical protein
MNIARFQAMLKLDMDSEKRTVIERLLEEAKLELGGTTSSKARGWLDLWRDDRPRESMKQGKSSIRRVIQPARPHL